MPPALANRPVLPTILEDYFNAFFRMHLRRQYTMGSELPFLNAEIESYGNMHGFDTDMLFFYRCMTEMDTEVFKYQSERNKQKKEAPSAAPKPPARRPARRR